jgi:hypothetical protein
MPKTRRTVLVLCLAAFLALPLMAQPQRESNAGLPGFFSSVWEWLTGVAHGTASVTSVWEEDDSVPVESALPSPGGTGRGEWDPNG